MSNPTPATRDHVKFKEKNKSRVYMIDDPRIREQIQHHTFTGIPHTSKLGWQFVDLAHDRAVCELPYKREHIGNITNGAIHTGVLISLLDGISGLAVMCALPAFEPFATLDLRVDCLKPSSAEKSLFAEAECYRLTNTIAFVRGCVYHDSPAEPIATCVATFFRSRAGAGQALKEKSV